MKRYVDCPEIVNVDPLAIPRTQIEDRDLPCTKKQEPETLSKIGSRCTGHTRTMHPQRNGGTDSLPITPNNGMAPIAWKHDTKRHLNKATGIMHSSRGLRSASQTVDAVTRKIQKLEQSHVESALQEKMTKSAGLRRALHHACEKVQQQIEAVVSEKGKLESLATMKKRALELSVSRYQLRTSRPQREHTSDNTQSLLCKQQAQLQKSIKAINSCVAEADNLYRQLMSLRSAMEYDLRDKAHALELDARALSLDGRQQTPISMQVGSATVPFRENTWARKTSVTIDNAKKVAADTERLQRRIHKMEKDLEVAEAEVMRDVQQSLKLRLGETLGAATVLDKKLKSEYMELENAARSKDRIVQALDSKRLPMDLVQQRYSTRHTTRPGREAVHDEVEVALATEFSELNAMVRELSKKHKKIDTTIKSLNTSAYSLENNLRDKRAAYDVDAQCYRMAAGWHPSQSHPHHP